MFRKKLSSPGGRGNDRLVILLHIKWQMIANVFRKLHTRSRFELFTLVFFFFAAAGGLFLFFFHAFRFFNSQEPFGPILIDETFYLFSLTLFVMLVISSGVSAYTSLYRSQEVPFLLTRPVAWSDIYFLKLTEALWYSSWSFLFIVIPFIMAYGLNKNVELVYFPLLCLAVFLPFVVLAATLGSLAATLTVWLLPSRKRRRVALILAVIAGVVFFMKTEPGFVKEQGSIAGILSGYLPHIAYSKFPLLPSYWATHSIETFSLFYFLVLLSNTLFFFIPTLTAAQRLYPYTFLRAQDYSEYDDKRRVYARQFLEKFLDILPWPSRPALAFMEKDVKTFLRDPSEWSQLIIFFGMLLLYFINLKNFEFHILKSFWKNIVFILNTVGTYIVLSSFNMRFVFPMLSMEGTKFWLIKQAPIRYSSMLLVKFFLGTLISAVLTLPLVFLSGWMLEISLRRILFTTATGFFVCVALTGLSVGFGARFPNFKSNNPSEIISGFGGSSLLISHLSYLAFVGVFLALQKIPPAAAFWIIATASLLIGVIPLKVGINSLKKLEF